MSDRQPIYDTIGVDYAQHRQPDHRIALQIAGALAGCDSVVNIGAGTGSYEPRDRAVVAVEPSIVMIAQRSRDAAPAIQGSAEHLPFEDGEFDAAMAVLTVHHWSDLQAGLLEMMRVARKRIIVMTWDPRSPGFWLVRDYFPDILAIDRTIFPPLDLLRSIMGEIETQIVPVPHDCTDGFLGAYWRRPEAYLDDLVRNSISAFPRITDVDRRMDQLSNDLASGQWVTKNRRLMSLDALDTGYRLVTCNLEATA